MTVGEKIRKYRKEAGMTQAELGKKAGLSEAMIRQYELGKRNPKFENLNKIAKALNITIDELGMVIIKHSENMHYFDLNRLSDAISAAYADEYHHYEIECNYEIDGQEKQLLESYNKLNELGQKEAIKRIEELTEIPKYQKGTQDN